MPLPMSTTDSTGMWCSLQVELTCAKHDISDLVSGKAVLIKAMMQSETTCHFSSQVI